MAFFQNLAAIWQKIGIVQRALLAAILLACGATIFLLTQWASKPEMRLLYSGLPPEEAAKITDKLVEEDIPYELRAGGTAIYVPSDSVHQTRLNMAKEGLPEGGQNGYRIFEKQPIGQSPIVQQLNINRAIEEELAKTIQMLDGVDYARVHIVRPEQTLFTTTPNEATASVVLQMKTGRRLSMASVTAITNMVAGAVDALESDQVTVVDCQGRMLTSSTENDEMINGANTFMDYKDRVEQTTAQKVQEMLEAVLGPGHSTVKVNANVEMVTQETMTKKYDKGVPQEEIVSETSTVEPGELGEEGTPVTGGSTEKDSTVETRLMVPETITKRMESPGRIVSLSVAAVVDLNVPVTSPTPPAGEVSQGQEGEQAGTAPQPAMQKIMTIEQVKDVIRQAVGPKLLLDENGQESLTVIEAPFNRAPTGLAAIPVDDEAMKWDKIAEMVRQSSMGILSVCAVGVLWIFTRAMKKTNEEDNIDREKLDNINLGLLPAATGNEPLAVFRQHIADRVKENPEEVRNLFASWLMED